MKPESKILVVGYFSTVGAPAVARNYLARLNTNGTLDTDFNANLATSAQGQSQYPRSIVVQADGMRATVVTVVTARLL